jgi:phenylalanyl-tRNA synthetase beta chain
LLEAVKHNNARQSDSIALYETGSVFLSKGEGELPDEQERVAGAITGLWHAHGWQGEKKVVDFYVIKGVLEGLFAQLGLEKRISYAPVKKDGMHPGRTAAVWLDEKEIGYVGQVHPVAQKQYGLRETYVFELHLQELLAADVEEVRYSAIPRFPSITRDIALVVDKNVLAGEVQRVIYTTGGELLKDVTVFDLYEGERMEEGKKSVAFSLRYLDPERTLTDEEVAKAHGAVLEAVEKEFGATLRS